MRFARLQAWSARTRCALLLVAAAAMVSLSACQDKGRPAGRLPADGTVIAFINPNAEDAQWPAVIGGAQAMMSRYPFLRLVPLAATPGEPTTLDALVDQALARGARGVALWVTEPGRSDIPIDRLRRAGVLIVAAGSVPDAHPDLPAVVIDYGAAAATLAGRLPEIAAGRQSYVLLHERERDTVATAAHDEFMALARLQSTVHLLTDRNAATEPSPPHALVRSMLDEYRHAGLVVTLGPGHWWGTEPRFTLPDGCRFVTLSAAPVLWSRLRDGEAAALGGPLDGDVGRAAVERLAALLMAEPVPPAARVIPSELVTRETLAEFSARYAAAAGLPLADLATGAPATQPVTPP